MQKIRIKKAPKPGDQQDYSVVGRNVSFSGQGAATSNVKNTMGATTKNKANIEVEGGETVVGDVNQDGFLEHFSFVGKRHSNGGMPVNVPEGSFIFSDTKKLKIKDKEVLESIFGLKEKKGGYTPAEIAKKYQINQFVEDLKSEDTDPIQKRSAAEMLKKNTEKLGMLALVQESMKGFPDGIPAIAESVMAGMDMSQMQGQPEQPMEQATAMYGGVKKYPDGGLVNGRPTKGYTLYINNSPVKVKSADIAQTLEFPYKKDYIILENGQRFTQEQFNKIIKGEQFKVRATSRGDIPDLSFKPDFVTVYTAKPRIQSRTIQDESGANTKLKVSTGDKLTYKGVAYEVVSPYGEYSKDYAGSWKNVRDKLDNTHGIITIKDAKGNVTFLEGEDLGELYKLAPDQVVVNAGTYLRNSNVSTPAADPVKKLDAFGNSIDSAPAKVEVKAPPAASVTPAASTPKPPAQPRPTGKPKTAQEALNYFARGGSVYDQYQVAGEVTGGPTEPPTNTGLSTTVKTEQDARNASNQRVDPNQEIFVGNITLVDGTVLKAYYKGNQKYVKDANGTILATGTRTDTNFEQYGSGNINQILSKAENVKYTKTNFGSFANQPNVKGTGIYLSSGNAKARSSGDLSPEEWADFQERHGDWIEKEYDGGYEKFKTDLRTSKATGEKAGGFFQDAINEKSMAKFGVPYFAPKGSDKAKNPYTRDSFFGQVTYSVPRFFDAPPPQTQPGDEMSYFCVEYTDGTKNVVSVSHKTGVAPVAPSGGNIKTVGSASKDKAVIDGQCITAPDMTTEKPPKKEGPWWLQDIVNYVGTMTDPINRYAPSQAKVDLVTPGYDLLDPTRKLAANQEQMARFQSQVENTADGNVAAATVLGSSGEGFANAANVLAADEAANIGIVNQAYGVNAGITNTESLGNENARQKYVDDMATLNQQYDNSLQQRKYRQIAAFNNGTTNWFRKKQMEQVLFPQVYTDPIMGDVDFSGQGRQVLDEDGTGMAPQTYTPAYMNNNQGFNMGTGMMGSDGIDNWQNIFEQAAPIMGDAEARRYATRMTDNQMQMQNRMATQFGQTQRQQYNQMMQQGLTLPLAPQQLQSRQFGGTIYLPWTELE